MTSFFDSQEILSAVEPQNLTDLVQGGLLTASGVWEAAASEPHAGRLKTLGLVYATGRGVAKNPKRAYGFFKRAANLGEKDSAFYVAMALREGFGVSRNLVESFAWLRTAAQSNQRRAVYEMAVALENAWGCEKNLPEANALYEKAALLGDKNALRHLITAGLENASDASEPLKWLDLEVENEVPEALHAKALQIIRTEPENISSALSLLERGAELEDTLCLAALASLWREGKLSGQDMVPALVYAHMAASRGNYVCGEWLDKWREETSPEVMLKAAELASLPTPAAIVESLRKRRTSG